MNFIFREQLRLVSFDKTDDQQHRKTAGKTIIVKVHEPMQAANMHDHRQMQCACNNTRNNAKPSGQGRKRRTE